MQIMLSKNSESIKTRIETVPEEKLNEVYNACKNSESIKTRIETSVY